MANMDAVLVRRTKVRLPGGYMLEIVVWILPSPVPGSSHRYKYRMFYGSADGRVVGYDNERGKGDHKHVDGKEQVYEFSGLDQLLTDFQADVEKHRRHK